MLGDAAGTAEFVADMHTVRNIACKHYGPAPFAKAVPVLDDVADQLHGIDAFRQLALDIVAALDPDAAQIGLRRRVDPGGTKYSPLVNSPTEGHSTITSKIFPSPRPSLRHGVAVRPMMTEFG